MKKIHRKPQKYMPAIIAASRRLRDAGAMEPGTVHVIDVVHDDWCPRLSGGECICNVEIGDVREMKGNVPA